MARAAGSGKKAGEFYTPQTVSVARMNMLLHGLKDTEFAIHHGDTLENDFNLNISRYVSTAEAEPEIEIKRTNKP